MSRDAVTEAPHDVVRVQEQLLEMLRSAGKDNPPPRREAPEPIMAVVSPAPTDKTAPAGHTPDRGCPKCSSKTPWGTSSWCPECGYYPRAGEVLPAKPVEPEIVEDAFELVEDEAPKKGSRLKWLAIGVVVILGASIGGLSLSWRPSSEGTTDVTASTSPEGDLAVPAVTETPVAQRTEPAEPPTPGAGTVPTEPQATFDYWIYGYTTNPEGEIRSLLLAHKGETGSLRFAQKLGLDGLSSAELLTMREQLKPYRTRNTALASPYGGKWVKPVAKCRVKHDGLNSDSRPTNIQFLEVALP